MTNKKFLAPLFVAMSLLLVACSSDEVVAKPEWTSNKIINIDGLKDNSLDDIYKTIKELGTTNSTILDFIMQTLAEKQVGTFNELSEIVSKINGNTITDAELDAFVTKYPIYKSEEYGYIDNGSSTTKQELPANVKRDVSKDKIKRQYNKIVEKVFEKLYEEIKGGSFNTTFDKLFQEEKYIRHLVNDFYLDAKYIDPTETNKYTEKAGQKHVFFSKPECDDNGAELTWKHFVNFDGSTDNIGYIQVMDSSNKLTEYYKGYVTRKLLPDIYRSILTEKYVKEQRYNNLGRTYARKVNMIAIPKGNYPTEISDMLKKFAIANITGDDSTTPSTVTTLNDNFEVLNKAMIGIVGTSGTKLSGYTSLTDGGFPQYKYNSNVITWKLPISANGEPVDANNPAVTTEVFYGTKLAEVFETFKKAVEINNATIDLTAGTGYTKKKHMTSDAKTAYEELTDKGAHSIEKGLEFKIREIMATDMTTDGWYLKSDSLSQLGDNFREKLFNITTSIVVDDFNHEHEFDDTVAYFNDDNNKYAAFVVGESSDFITKPEEAVVLSDDANFYICEVREAASSSKLSDEPSRSYLDLKSTNTLGDSNIAMNEIVDKIVGKLSSGDTYKSNAEQYYIMISNIIFNDQSMYDYFKTQFPDLF